MPSVILPILQIRNNRMSAPHVDMKKEAVQANTYKHIDTWNGDSRTYPLPPKSILPLTHFKKIITHTNTHPTFTHAPFKNHQ